VQGSLSPTVYAPSVDEITAFAQKATMYVLEEGMHAVLPIWKHTENLPGGEETAHSPFSLQTRLLRASRVEEYK
jgi:hypothetical protein